MRFESTKYAVPAIVIATALWGFGCGNAGGPSGAKTGFGGAAMPKGGAGASGAGSATGGSASGSGASSGTTGGGAPAPAPSGGSPKVGSPGFGSAGGIGLTGGTTAGGSGSSTGPGAGSGTGTGTGTTTPPPASTAPPVVVRAVAWNLDDVLPTGPGPQPTNTCWLLFRDPGNTDILSINILINNFAMPTNQVRPRKVGKTGILVEFSPAPTITGNNVQMKALDTSGNPIESQVMTTTNSYYWPAGTVPPAFKTISPPQGWIAPQTPSFTFTNVAPATTYNVVCFHLVPLNGHMTAHEIPVCVEVRPASGPQTTFVDGTQAGVVTEICNDPLPPVISPLSGEYYAWHVVALDPTGWEFGTTVDVPGYDNGVAAALDTWPWFDTF